MSNQEYPFTKHTFKLKGDNVMKKIKAMKKRKRRRIQEKKGIKNERR